MRRGLVLGLLVAAVGCGDGAPPAELEEARQSIQTGLDAWQRGEKPAALKAAPVLLDFYDDDWQRSAKLLKYEIRNAYLETDGTPRCAVQLEIQYPRKTPQTVKVTYQMVVKEGLKVVARDPFS